MGFSSTAAPLFFLGCQGARVRFTIAGPAHISFFSAAIISDEKFPQKKIVKISIRPLTKLFVFDKIILDKI